MKPTNTNAPRTIDGIYLQPSPNIQGGHEVMSLSSGVVIYPRKVTAIPMTDSIIKLVEKMGYDQGIKLLKLSNRKKNIFYPSEWTEGKDQEEDDNYEYIEENDDSKDDINDEELYDCVDQEEINELLAEPEGINKEKETDDNNDVDEPENEMENNNEDDNIVSQDEKSEQSEDVDIDDDTTATSGS